jgi:hypothetical protein
MQKLFSFLLLIFVLFFYACHSNDTSQLVVVQTPADSTNIFPVTSFLKAQLKQLDTMQVTPLLMITQNEKTDSTWLKRGDIRKRATPFLSPEIDSVTMYSLFTENSFLDQTINAYTFSYDPKKKLPDSIHLIHWDVYMNPQTNSIERIYMVKKKDSADQNITTQLTWLVNKWYSIRTITQIAGHKAQVSGEKMIWNFD